jgi:ubiquinol-cytochrome c reductase cytochrome b subunit
MPEGGGYFLEYNNFFPADPLVTPPHIAPVWYFTPYYSILRAVTYPLFGIDAKFWGVVAMGAGDADLRLPALAGPQPGEVDPLSRPDHKWLLAIFIVGFFILGYLGMLRPNAGLHHRCAQICSVYLLPVLPDLMPIWYSSSTSASRNRTG